MWCAMCSVCAVLCVMYAVRVRGVTVVCLYVVVY